MYNFPTIKMLWGKKIKDYMFENKVPKKKKKSWVATMLYMLELTKRTIVIRSQINYEIMTLTIEC